MEYICGDIGIHVKYTWGIQEMYGNMWIYGYLWTYMKTYYADVEIYENTDDNSWFSSLGLEGVMVMEIKPNSIAEENNIQQGDVIIEMGKKEIQNVNDYSSELETYNKGDTIMLRILRNVANTEKLWESLRNVDSIEKCL